VTISGISRMYEREVLSAAGIDWRTSVPFLDVGAVREKLLRVPLIAQVSVRKIYPNEIAITQVEREPAALWQKNGEISVIAADGTVIDAMRDDRYASLPLVVGEDANTKLPEYLALIAAAGPLAERIKAGTYVSGRRWTLKLDGVDVRLPEVDPAAALARLVRFEREAGLLEKDIIAVDLRMPDRVVVRLTEEAAAARAESQKAKKKGAAS
jgi:cell division protein FtsQ